MLTPTYYERADSVPAHHFIFNAASIADMLIHPLITLFVWIPATVLALYEIQIHTPPQTFLLLGLISRLALLVCTCLLVAGIIQVYTALISSRVYSTKKDWSRELAVVTGGSGGVGYLLCKTLAGLGAKVAILDINRPSSFDAGAYNGRLRFYQCDVSDYGQVQAAVKTINQDFGMQPVTILVNNAGIVKGLSIGELSESDIRKVYGVNTLSGYWSVKSILPQMQESRYGHIVTVSSTMGITAVAEMSDYCGSKFAACGFHEALRQELNGLPYKHRIQTTLVCPGLILTGMFSGIKINVPFLTPPLKPEHVVEKIVHALHRQVETDGFLSLTQKHKVIWTPSSYYFIAALGLLTPVWVCDFVKEVLGANRALGNLHSKSKK